MTYKYDLFKCNFCIKTNPVIFNVISTDTFFCQNCPEKRNPIFIGSVVGFTVCNTVMDHLFVNNAVQLLVEHITHWGQYGRCTQSLCSANGRVDVGGVVQGNTVPDRGALWRD